LLSLSIKGKDLIPYQNLVSEDYAQKSGKSRTIANKFGMYWYVTRAHYNWISVAAGSTSSSYSPPFLNADAKLG
jgi:hypothetical protein